MEIEIKKLKPDNLQEFIELLKVFEVVFELKDFKLPPKDHLRKLLSRPDFLVIVACNNEKVVGGLTVYILDQYYSSRPSAFIYDLGVHVNFQRKGIGKMLMTFIIRYCKENGFKEAFVEAETEDIEAVHFYRSTPINEELQATHFTYSFHE